MNPEARAGAVADTNPAEVASAIKRVMDHPDAGTFLTWMMDTCNATTTPYDDNPYAMAASVGRQQVWMALNTILSMDARDIAAVRNQMSAWEKSFE